MSMIVSCHQCGQVYNAAFDFCLSCGFETDISVAHERADLVGQSKLASLTEAVVNTVIGLALSFAAQLIICWAYSIQLTYSDNLIITGWMTGVSVLRSYAVRRIWNGEFWKGLRT